MTSLLARVVAVLVGLQIAALAAVAMGDAVPDQPIVDSLNAAIGEGSVTSPDPPHSETGGPIDAYGECVLFGMGLGEREEDGWFKRIATSPNLYSCPSTINRLEAHSEGEPLVGVYKRRYWNGLSAVSRPVLAVVGVDGLRLLAVLALSASLVFLAKEVSAATGAWATLALLGPFVLTGDLINLVQVFHHPLMLAVGFAGVAVLARRAVQDRGWDELVVPALVVGSVYCFVNLMNYVPGLWALAAGVVAACVPPGRDWTTRLGRTLAVGVAWPAGYLSMWAGKWTWAAVTTSWSAMADEIFGQIDFRITGETRYASGMFGAGLRATVGFWLDEPLAPAVLVLAALLVVAVAIRGAPNRSRVLTAGVIACPSPILVPWALVFNNHHEIHYWFEYRSLPLMVGIMMMACCSAVRLRPTGAKSPAPAVGPSSAGGRGQEPADGR